MKRAFTLVELLLASGLTVIVFAAVFGSFYASWRLAGDVADEALLTIKARNARERLEMHLADSSESGKKRIYMGLAQASNLTVSASGEITANFYYAEYDGAKTNYLHDADAKRLSDLIADRFRYAVDVAASSTNCLRMWVFVSDKALNTATSTITHDGHTVRIDRPYYAEPMTIIPSFGLKKQ